MHTIEVKEINFRRFIPENLAECDRGQYLDMAKLILMYQMTEINLEQFRMLAFYTLMNMQISENKEDFASDEKMLNIYQCSELINSFFDIDENGNMHIVQDYIHNPVKSISYKLHRFYGPKDGFENITWKQLIEGIGELQSFQQTGDMLSLLKIFAMFYLKKGEKLSSIDLDKRVKYFELLDIRYVYGFYLLFTSFWKFLISDANILVDGREINLSLLFSSSNEESDAAASVDLPELGLRSTAFQLAESGVFGAMDQLNETNAWEILLRMYDMLVRNEKREAELEEQNKS